MDWIIHGVLSEKCPSMVDYHTHGLEDYDHLNLCMFYDFGDDGETNSKIINTIADMMVHGEKFIPGITHYIDDDKGSTLFKFKLWAMEWHREIMFRIIIEYVKGKELDKDKYKNQFLKTEKLEEIFGE